MPSRQDVGRFRAAICDVGSTVETNSDADESQPGGGIAGADERVVPGDDRVGRGRQPPQCGVAREHGPHVEHDGEGPAGLDDLLEVGQVRPQHPGAPRGLDAHDLQPVGVATDQMDRQAGSELLVAGAEVKAP
jgi:hypothetical protein